MNFDTNQALLGTNITHTNNSSDFIITIPGTYTISYNTIVTSAAGTTPPVSTSVELRNGGVVIPGTTTSTTLTDTGDTATLSGTTTIQITTVPSTITLNALNTNGTFSSASVTIHSLNTE